MTGIIFLLNLEYAPFIKKYTEQLELKGEEFEVIFWERMESEYSIPWKTVIYRKRGKLGDSKFRKAISFLGYRRFLIKTLKQKKYDKVIVLTTLTGMIIGDFLIRNYKDRFIFDIRDYTFEKNSLFYFFEKMLIRSSYFTAISSEGFKEFLPKYDKYLLSHNILLEEVSDANSFASNEEKKEIGLSFIGAVRHHDIDKTVVDLFGNDSRFKVYFHGYGVSYNALTIYCENKYHNVFLTGKYNRKDKAKLLQNATVLNSYYSSDNYANKYALPNKYYDALIYKIPLWANPEVYVGKRAIEAGIGLNILLDNEAADNMYDIMSNFDWLKFEEKCNQELFKVLNEDNEFVEACQQFISF